MVIRPRTIPLVKTPYYSFQLIELSNASFLKSPGWFRLENNAWHFYPDKNCYRVQDLIRYTPSRRELDERPCRFINSAGFLTYSPHHHFND